MPNQKKISQTINSKLTDSHKEVSHDTTEVKLKGNRKETENTLTENLLEKNRSSAVHSTTEARLNSEKSKFGNNYRNEKTHKGNLPKLEEQRVANNKKKETEKYEPSAQTPKMVRWWDNASKDGLKLASIRPFKKIAQWEDDEEEDEDLYDDRLPSERGDFSDFADEDDSFGDDFEVDENIVENLGEEADVLPEEDFDDIDDFEIDDISDDIDDKVILEMEAEETDIGGTPMVSGSAVINLDPNMGIDPNEISDSIITEIKDRLSEQNIDADITEDSLTYINQGSTIRVEFLANSMSDGLSGMDDLDDFDDYSLDDFELDDLDVASSKEDYFKQVTSGKNRKKK